MNFLTTKIGASPVIIIGTFPVSAARAYKAWTSEDEIIQWFGTEPFCVKSASIDLSVGGSWKFIFEDTPQKTISLQGEYIEIIPNEKLVFSWKHVTENKGEEKTSTAPSKVTVKFRELNGETTITLHHENINNEDGRKGVGSGWQCSFESLQNIFKQSSGKTP